MSRGEAQKPVTQSYRDNWDDIFGKKEDKPSTQVLNSKNHKEPCSECRDGYVVGGIYYDRCEVCGGIGSVEPQS